MELIVKHVKNGNLPIVFLVMITKRVIRVKVVISLTMDLVCSVILPATLVPELLIIV